MLNCIFLRSRRVTFRKGVKKGLKALRVVFVEDNTGKEHVQYFRIGQGLSEDAKIIFKPKKVIRQDKEKL